MKHKAEQIFEQYEKDGNYPNMKRELLILHKSLIKERCLSWTDVKNKYITFHSIDKFTENMSIDVDFAYWLIYN